MMASTGTAAIHEPPTIAPSGHWFGAIWPFVRPERRPIAEVLLLLVISSLVAAATPWPVTLVVDSALGGAPLPGWAAWTTRLPGAGGDTGFVVWMAIGVVGLYGSSQVLGISRSAIEVTTGHRITYRIGAAVFDRGQRMPLTRHANWPVGDLMARIQHDAGCGRDLVFRMLTPGVAAVVTLATTSIVMVSIQPVLWLVAVASAVPSALAGPIGHRSLSRLQRENAEVEAARGAIVEQSLSALPSVRVLGVEAVVEERYGRLADRLVGIRKRLALVEGLFGLGIDVLFGLSSAGFLLVGGWMVLDDALTLGQLLVFLAYIQNLHGPLQTLVHLTTAYAGTSATAERVQEVLSLPTGAGGSGVGADLVLDGPPTITFTNTTFAYPHNPPTLNNLNLTINPGELIGITGPSGTGKSTLLTLLTRLNDPQTGTIHINNHNTKHLNPTTLRNNIATVLQEPFLFPTTIANNIALGHPNPTRTQIEQAATNAGVTTFTNHLPNGLDTTIGQRGATLSGGQQQRIAIARALIRNTPIVLLDEPTNALDQHSETHVMHAIKTLAKHRTTILISHRPTTLNHCTRTINLTNHQTPQPHPNTADTGSGETAGDDRVVEPEPIVGPPRPVLEIVHGARIDYFEPSHGVVEIGRRPGEERPGDEIVVGEIGLARPHLSVAWTDRGWTVEDVSSDGSYDQLGRRLIDRWSVAVDHQVHPGSPTGPQLRLRALPEEFASLVTRPGIGTAIDESKEQR